MKIAKMLSVWLISLPVLLKAGDFAFVQKDSPLQIVGATSDLKVKDFYSRVIVVNVSTRPILRAQGRQQQPLSLSLTAGDLHSERCVLEGHGLMVAEEQSEESKHQQEKHCHVSGSFLPWPFRVNRLRAD